MRILHFRHGITPNPLVPDCVCESEETNSAHGANLQFSERFHRKHSFLHKPGICSYQEWKTSSERKGEMFLNIEFTSKITEFLTVEPSRTFAVKHRKIPTRR